MKYMANSMTGFGRANEKFGPNQYSLEIRTLNHRFQEIYIRVPKQLANLENNIRKIIKNNVLRGKINVSIDIDQVEKSTESIKVNHVAANSYTDALRELKNVTGVDEEPTLSHLLRFDEIFSSAKEEDENPEFADFLENLTKKAAQDLNKMRADEGSALVADLSKRCEILDQSCKLFENLSKNTPREEFEKLLTRVQEMVKSGEIDRDRLEQEIALIADRVDISEEIVRLNSHIHLFRSELEKNEPIGKRLNFIVQEMNREVNTVGSKATNVKILHKVVESKEEIEKMREQIQNIE
jgi:uncharacterized protein (TIGR00255 family)